MLTEAPLRARLDGLTVELLSPYQLSLRARTRYGEQQLQADEGRVRRGVVGGAALGLSGPSFAERLRGLLPPEQTLSARDRMLATRAAEGLARYKPVSAKGADGSQPLDLFVIEGGLLSSDRNAGEEGPTAAESHLPAYYPPASRMLGLAQRTFGAPIDGTLAEALGFLDRDPIGARPLPSAREYLARRAAESYGLVRGQAA